jgi:hypothetical protein
MDIATKVQSFNKRWDIITAEEHQLSFEKFCIRVLNDFEDIDDLVTEEGIANFCRALGIRKYKHDPKYPFNEYLIYQAGVLARYIDQKFPNN